MSTSKAGTAAKPARKHGAVAETVEIVKTVVYALMIALVLRVFLFQPYTIPSASEEPNLFRGDYIIVTKWSYGWSQKSAPFLDRLPNFLHGRLLFSPPKRGDVVVFKLPYDGYTDYIKRIVGLPGDRIQVKGGQLYVNGQALATRTLGPASGDLQGGWQPVLHREETNPDGRRYVIQAAPSGEWQADNTGVFVVPQHCYFMMGDNRDDSLDSRFDPTVNVPGCEATDAQAPFLDPGGQHGVGFVPEENLEGKAQIILLSWNTGPDEEHPCCASIFKPWTWFTDARPSRFFKILH